MSLFQKRLVTAALAAGLAFAGLGLSAGSAAADEVRVVVPGPPVFFPAPQFNFNDGYYRTGHGEYYHYDRDRDGWHYGRNHREGVRYEERRGHRH